jgi:hypothetical protein
MRLGSTCQAEGAAGSIHDTLADECHERFVDALALEAGEQGELSNTRRGPHAQDVDDPAPDLSR